MHPRRMQPRRRRTHPRRRGRFPPAESRFGMTTIKGLMAEVVPFPKYAVTGVFPQSVKPCPDTNLLPQGLKPLDHLQTRCRPEGLLHPKAPSKSSSQKLLPKRKA